MRTSAMLSAALLCIAATANAQDFKKVEGLLPNRVEFDAPDGRYQHWDADVGCRANALRMIVTFKRLGKPTTKWQPAVAIVLQHGPNAATQDIVKFSVVAPSFAPPFRADLVTMRTEPAHPEGELLQVQNYATSFADEADIPVSIAWSADGEVAATFNGEEHTISLHGPIDYVRIAGSSGAGVLDPLEIGVVGDPSAAMSCKPIASAKAASPAG